MNVRKGSLEEYVDRIQSGENFTLARYGDGEWSAILGYKGKNCDGVRYTDGLCSALQNTLFNPLGYDYGMLAIAMRKMGNEVRRFISVHKLELSWVEATFLVAANRHGEISPLIDVLQNRRLIYVGPRHLRKIADLLPINKFIEVHPTESFANYKETVREVIYNKEEGDFVGVSSGPAAKVIIHSLFQHIGETHSIMDFGSIWDGYVGIPSRKYMRRNTWNELLARNLSNVDVRRAVR